MKILKAVFRRWGDFLCNNNLTRKLMYIQHRLFPMPLVFFDMIFRSGFRRRLFDFYGSNVANFSYLRRGGDQLGYWLSRESLYWHFWRQTDTNDRVFKEILSLERVKKFLSNGGGRLTAVELGFGLGKNYAKFLRHNNFKKYIAVEPNVYICDYIAKKFRANSNLEIINASVDDFIARKPNFDVLLCFGGVFMYLDPKTTDRLFFFLGTVGVKAIVILYEGTPHGDIYREDGTIMYNFKNRLLAGGYGGKEFIEKQNGAGIYDYFIVC